MPLMHCPHCGAENFTMEGWEDLDHCSSCGKPLGELDRDSLDVAGSAIRNGGVRGGRFRVRKDQGASQPRRA